jgi:RND family efflux transporter MFP subunit
MMRGVIATVAVVAAVALALVVAQSGVLNQPTPSPTVTPSGPQATVPSFPPISSPTPRPSATPIDTAVVASGTVVPLRSADLATRISGAVAAIYVHEGSEAAANQLLLKLDQTTYHASIDVAQKDVQRATAAVDQAQLQVDQLPPVASPGQVESAQANLRLAQAELQLAQATLNDAQTALLQTEVRAPFAGTIADLNVEVGEQAIAGQTVITIGDISGWLVETTDVSELDVVRLAVGDPATMTFDALPDLVLRGTVDRIQVRGTSDDGAVVFAVTIRPDVHRPDLRWGMSSTVRITPSG